MGRLPVAIALLASVALSPWLAAAAECTRAIERAEAKLAGIKPGGRAAQPAETWFGPPPGPEGARSLLDNARDLDERGDLKGCLEMVSQAERLIEGLEQPAER